MPPRNSLLHSLVLPRPQCLVELGTLLADIAGSVPGVEIVDLAQSSGTAAPAIFHQCTVEPPPAFTGFLLAAATNTWSRAARRKVQSSMNLDVSPDMEAFPMLLCRASWLLQPEEDSTLEEGRGDEENKTVMITTATLRVDWVRGTDRAMFESLTAHVVRKIRTALG